MRTPKFTFSKILMGQGEESQKYILRVQYCKAPSGVFVSFHFPRDFVEVFDLNGVLIEFLADVERKALAFRKLPSLKKEEWNKKTMKILKISANGTAPVGAMQLMKSIGVEPNNYKCPIETYKDSMYGDVWYIVFNDENKYIPRSRKQNEKRI